MKTFFLLISIVICLSLVGCKFNPMQGPVEEPMVVKSHPHERILTKWVYDNSSRISITTAKEIVSEVTKTKYPLLMLSIIEVESVKFTPGALSQKVGAIGWCQVNYAAHGPDLIKAGIIKEKRDLWDVAPNIRAGAFIFDQKLKRSNGDVNAALEGYLGGVDGAYTKRIMSTLSNLYILTQ